MSSPSGADEVSSCYSSSDLSSDGDRCRHQEEEEEDDYADDAGKARCLRAEEYNCAEEQREGREEEV